MFVRNERSIKDFIRFYPITSTIIIINLLLWFIISFLHLDLGRTIYTWGVGHNISVSYGEYWRLVTPIFLHGGLSHVIFNCFALVLFSPALEQMLGKPKFISFYFITGIIGNIGTYIIAPMSTTPHLGASGAIYGLFGIYIFMVFFRKSLIDQSNAQIVTVIFVIGLVMTFIQPNINIAAHIFGFLGGFAIAPLFLIRVERFSMAKNYARLNRHADHDEIGFDPNRWQKRKYRAGTSFKFGKVFWFVFIVLVMLGFISRFLPF
jgi:membrane associated rhomboid family serine protease